MRDRLRRLTDQAQARKHRPDYWLMILSLALVAIGVIVVYSISPALGKAHNLSGNYFVAKQGIAIGIGMLAFFITSRIPMNKWRQLCMPLLVIAGGATLVAMVMPVDAQYPAHRWIRLGSFSFQSVELLKFALLIWLAGMLADRIKNGTIKDSSKTLKPLLIALGVVGFVVAGVQSDLGSMAVIIAMIGVMAFVAGLPMRRLLLIGAAIALLVVLAVSTTPYRRERLATFLHPTADCQSAGYQACQALISVGSGGIGGLGLGRSVQAYGYLPEAANDSIFAIYAEKFGFIGVAVLLAVFAAFFSRLKSLAERAPDHFSRLIVMGIMAWLATQTIINIGAMLGLLPLKGITLPLVSYGGTSVVFVLAALGLVFHTSKYTSHSVQTAGAANGRSSNFDESNNTPRAFNRQSFERAVPKSTNASAGRARRNRL
jgi:cell division protein FtsW